MPLDPNLTLFEKSKHVHHAPDNFATLQKVREASGHCPFCGTECYRAQSKMFKKSLTALNVDGVVSHGRCLYCNPDKPTQEAPPADGLILAHQNSSTPNFDDNSSMHDSFRSVEQIPQTTSASNSQAGVIIPVVNPTQGVQKEGRCLHCTANRPTQVPQEEGLPHHYLPSPDFEDDSIDVSFHSVEQIPQATSYDDAAAAAAAAGKRNIGEGASLLEQQAHTSSFTYCYTCNKCSTTQPPEGVPLFVAISRFEDSDCDPPLAATNSMSGMALTQDHGPALPNMRSCANNQLKHSSSLGVMTSTESDSYLACHPLTPPTSYAQRTLLSTPIPDLQESFCVSLSPMSDTSADTCSSSGQLSVSSSEPSKFGHMDWIQSLALMSSDRVLSASDDTSIKLWSTSGDCIHTFTGHSGWIWSVAKMNDDSFLSVSQDMTAKLWDVNTRACVHTFEGHSGPVKSVVQMGQHSFLTGSADKTVKLWCVKTKKCLHTYCNGTKGFWRKKSHKGEVNVVAKLKTGLFLSGSDDKTIKLWDAVNDVLIRTFKGHLGYVHSVAKSDANCRFFVSASEDCTARIWNVDTGICTGVFKGHTMRVHAVEPLNDNQVLTASDDNTIRLWDVRTFLCLRTFTDHKNGVKCVMRLDKERFLSGSADKTVKMWDSTTGICLKTFPGPVETPKYLLSRQYQETPTVNAVNLWSREESAGSYALTGSSVFGLNTMQYCPMER